ncbi:hypothetical protein U1Q18_039024 [Sarracenia purpurea var. burkii]
MRRLATPAASPPLFAPINNQAPATSMASFDHLCDFTKKTPKSFGLLAPTLIFCCSFSVQTRKKKTPESPTLCRRRSSLDFACSEILSFSSEIAPAISDQRSPITSGFARSPPLSYGFTGNQICLPRIPPLFFFCSERSSSTN